MATITMDNVHEAFDDAAPRYDLLVGLNPGYHSHLRSAAKALVESLPAVPDGEPLRLVDLGCGSGASTAALVQAARSRDRRTEITGIDASAGMLDQARAKLWPDGVSFEVGRAEDLAWARADWGLADRVPGVLAAYLFRNVSERDKLLASVFDLVSDGGSLVIQEYSVHGSAGARRIWSLVCWLVVIPLSFLTGGSPRLYRYLWRSVLDFDSVQQLVDRLYAAGFAEVEIQTVPGWQRGILHTFRARKPVADTMINSRS